MRELQQLLEQQGLLLVFLNVLLEQLGLPIPAFPLLILVGALAMQGLISLPEALALAVLACVIADSVWNLAGRRHGSKLLRTICKLSLSQDTCIRSGLNVYASTGPKALLVSRFLPGAGALFTAMAGMHRTSWLVFWAYTGMGALIWAGTGLFIGLVFSDTVGDVLAWLSQYGSIGFAVVLGALALFIGFKFVKRRLLVRRTAKVPRITVKELAERHHSGQSPLVLDVRSITPTMEEGIPGALAVSLEAPIEELLGQLEHPGQDVVIYCACPKELSAAILAEKLQAHGVEHCWALQGGLEAWQAYSAIEEPEPQLQG